LLGKLENALRVYAKNFEESPNGTGGGLAEDGVIIFAKDIITAYLSVCNTQFKRHVSQYVSICIFM
jgi:hypothetical protein